MTLEDTRRLGIEFERRVQTMIPEKEFLEKLDTDTIYSYLNQYQDKYIHEIYRNLDSIPSGSKLQTHVDSVLQPLLHSTTVALSDNGVQDNVTSFSDDNGIEIIDSARSVVYPLPDDFYMYVKSVSRVSSTFSFRAGSTTNVNDGKIRVLPNMLLSQNDLLKVIETPHDSLRILRYPAASLTHTIPVQVPDLYYNTVLSAIGEDEAGFLYLSDQVAAVTINGTTYSIYKLKEAISNDTTIITGAYDDEIEGYENIQLYAEDGFVLTQDGTLCVERSSDNTLISYFDESEKTATLEAGDAWIPYKDKVFAYYDGHIYMLTQKSEFAYNAPLELAQHYENRRSLTVIYDQYTTPMGVKVTYYREPKHFDIMTSTACELPIDAFEELVSGAVDLYVQYVAGAEARKKQIEEARRQAAKEQEANNARRGRNSE